MPDCMLGWQPNYFPPHLHDNESGLEVMLNFNSSLKLKYRQIKKFFALSLSDVVFIMLITA